jgi:dsRNA-specific ribonuclease
VGEGYSKKESEQNAAKEALENLGDRIWANLTI